MATRSYIRVILKEEDRNRDMKFNPEMIKIENTWGDEQLDIEPWTDINPEGKDALMIYHHWDGYPDGVGETLLSEYNDYDKALNLVLGGDVSTINDKYAPYALREGEEWEDVAPKAVDEDELTNEDYEYMFKDGKWYVRSDWDRDMNEWTELSGVLEE